MAKERIIKIDEIYNSILSCKKRGASKVKLIARCCISWGTQKRTVREYVTLLIEAGKIKEVDGRLFPA